MWGIVSIIVLLIIVAGVIAVLHIVLPKLGVTIPQWIIQILWICFVVFVAIVAIKFLVGLF